jgi:hypothetical protein
MGSHFMTLYACDPDALVAKVGSGDPGQTPGDAPEEAGPFLDQLIQGAYPRADEHDDAPELIRAFELLCKALDPNGTAIEMYEDEDESPELYRFCWAEWDGDDPFELPFSPHGVPAVTYHGPAATERWAKIFTELRDTEWNEDMIAGEDLDELISALDSAASRGTGVFLFLEY